MARGLCRIIKSALRLAVYPFLRCVWPCAAAVTQPRAAGAGSSGGRPPTSPRPAGGGVEGPCPKKKKKTKKKNEPPEGGHQNVKGKMKESGEQKKGARPVEIFRLGPVQCALERRCSLTDGCWSVGWLVEIRPSHGHHKDYTSAE